MAATQFPIVLEPEVSGVISAYIPGLLVYAQGATKPRAIAAIRRTLAAYLTAHPDTTTKADVKVATIRAARAGKRPTIAIAGPAALVGGPPPRFVRSTPH